MALTRIRAEQISGIPVIYEPILSEIQPFYMKPNITGSIIIIGEFFNPQTTLQIDGCVINSVTLLNSQKLEVGITTGSIEGNFNVTINNGKSKSFYNSFTINIGEITIPVESDFSNLNVYTVQENSLKLGTWNVANTGTLNIELDRNQDFIFSFRAAVSPISQSIAGAKENSNKIDFNTYIKILSAVDDSVLDNMRIAAGARLYTSASGTSSGMSAPGLTGDESGFWHGPDPLEIRCINGNLFVYYLGEPTLSLNSYGGVNIKIAFEAKELDFNDLKIII